MPQQQAAPEDATLSSADSRADATSGYCVFDTALGACGLAWGAGGITGVELPDSTAHETADALAARFPGTHESTLPPPIARVTERIQALLAGSSDDLADVELDLSACSDFEQRAYAVARTIPPGRTMTYGEVAAAVGSPGAARAVGRAMGANPSPIVVPCHRVVGAGGAMIGFSAHGGASTKRRMLIAEGVAESEEPALFTASELYEASARSV